MTTRWPYDARFVPAAPVAPTRFASPLRADAVALPALLDTGADASVIPAVLARRLRLPPIGYVRLAGITGAPMRCPLVAARVEIERTQLFARLIAYGDEAIIGRDILNRWVTRLDGPARLLSVSVRRRARARRP
jgi:predicted aspartyl protease